MQEQIFIFIIFILNGFIIGLLFDCFRILRISFKTPDFITYVEDALLGILSGILILFSIFKFNNGELRLYPFIGLILGILLYLLAFSKVFIHINIFIIKIIKKIVNKLIIIPSKFIYRILKKILFKPIILICINIRKIFSKINIFKSRKIKNKLCISLIFKKNNKKK